MSAEEQTGVSTIEAEQPAAEKKTLDITAIQAILPHRYPFLLIDRVIEIERKKRIVAIKNVTSNEPYFMGHFPKSFFPLLNGGTLAIVLCFSCLYLAAAGGGPLSLDAFLRVGTSREPDARGLGQARR